MRFKNNFCLFGWVILLTLIEAKASTFFEPKGLCASVLLTVDPQEIVFGEDNAPITVIEYTALSCNHCAHFHTSVLPEIRKKYIDTGKIRFVFRHFPIDQYSLKAATILTQVPLPKRVAVIDQIFAEQQNWLGPNAVKKLAAICKLPVNKCQKIADDQTLLNQMLQHRLEIEKVAQIEGTPTFFINGKMYPMTLTLTQFEEIMTQEEKSSP